MKIKRSKRLFPEWFKARATNALQPRDRTGWTLNTQFDFAWREIQKLYGTRWSDHPATYHIGGPHGGEDIFVCEPYALSSDEIEAVKKLESTIGCCVDMWPIGNKTRIIFSRFGAAECDPLAATH
jgi:hypothetical protein